MIGDTYIRRDPGDDQLSEYAEDSSDNKNFSVEEDGAIADVQKEELGFLLHHVERKVDGKQQQLVCNFCLKKSVLLCFCEA